MGLCRQGRRSVCRMSGETRLRCGRELTGVTGLAGSELTANAKISTAAITATLGWWLVRWWAGRLVGYSTAIVTALYMTLHTAVVLW